MLHIKPGTVAPIRSLLGVLREAHADKVAAYERDQAHRKAAGAPPSEAEDGQHPEAPKEWEDPEGLDGVMVAPVILSATHRADLLTSLREAYGKSDVAAALKAEDAYVCATLFLVEGLTGPDDRPTGVYRDEGGAAFTADDMQGFRASGLFPWLFAAMVHMQNLPSGKAWRFGVHRPST